MRTKCPYTIGRRRGVHLKSESVLPHARTDPSTYLTLCRAPHPPTISGTADSRISAIRDRHDIIKQTILRNDHFSPSTLPGKDKDRLLNVRANLRFSPKSPLSV